jgi:heat-inducible transcriptional repressor
VLAVTDLSVHLVLVMADGSIEQQRLLLETPTQQEELSAIASRLNPRLQGKNADEINQLLLNSDPSPVERIIVNGIIRLLEQHSEIEGDVFFGEDLVNILDQNAATPAGLRLAPEDERVERIRKVMEELEQKRLQQVMEELEHKRILPALASHLPSTDGVQVIIGGENQWDEMKDVSMVLARYGRQGKVGGLLGIIGPTRMQYGRAIAVVRYMAQVMDELLADVYGVE